MIDLFDDGLARDLDGLNDLFFHHHGLAGDLDGLSGAGRGDRQQHCGSCNYDQPTK